MDPYKPTDTDLTNDTEVRETTGWKPNISYKWLSHWFWIILIIFVLVLIALIVLLILTPILSHHRDIRIRSGNITGSVMRMDGMEPTQVSFSAPSGIFPHDNIPQMINALNNRMVVGGNRFATASYNDSTDTITLSIADGFGWVVLHPSTPMGDLGFPSGVALFRDGFLSPQGITSVEGCPIFDESLQR